jgi:hypothetical protein
MSFTQQQLDDLLEDLIALTDTPDCAEQVRRLSRLCLMLIEQVDDAVAVQRALDEVLASCEPRPVRPIE